MDDATLASLRAAFELTPQNHELLRVLLDAYLAREEAADAVPLLADVRERGCDDPRLRELASRVLLDAGEPAAALELLERVDAPTPEDELAMARAHLALGDRASGTSAYESAIARNSTLADAELARQLRGSVREIQAVGDRPRLRVISNDDTDDTEIDRLLHPEPERVSFADVGGLSEIKQQIRKKIILPFEKPGLFQKFRKRAGGGILMYGPPGCGKTLLARATAGECNATFFNVAISDVLDMYIGESEQKLHALFEKARTSTPSVLFFDEIEAIGGKRQFTREATSSKLVSQFLAEMDGFAKNNSGVLILGATNVPWAVDPAFRRPGRFDRVLFVPPPDREARRAILELQLANRPCGDGLDLAPLASRSSGFSGADLANLVETAADEAIEASLEAGRELPIGQADLLAALKATKPTTLEWLTTARNYARYANESGHYDDVLAFLDRYGKD